VLVIVCAADRLETSAHHDGVLHLPTLQRFVRDDVLQGRRDPRFSVAVERRHRGRIPGGRTRARRH